MKIRLYKINDLEKIMSLYYDTVHSINANDYTEEQLDAMAPGKPNVYHWETQLNKNHTLVAVDNQDTIIGFGNIGQTGFLDRLYVDKDHVREGIATKLVNELENYARKKGNERINTISTSSSLPFFESLGYVMLEEYVNEMRGVRIVRYIMEKTL